MKKRNPKMAKFKNVIDLFECDLPVVGIVRTVVLSFYSTSFHLLWSPSVFLFDQKYKQNASSKNAQNTESGLSLRRFTAAGTEATALRLFLLRGLSSTLSPFQCQNVFCKFHKSILSAFHTDSVRSIGVDLGFISS